MNVSVKQFSVFLFLAVCSSFLAMPSAFAGNIESNSYSANFKAKKYERVEAAIAKKLGAETKRSLFAKKVWKCEGDDLSYKVILKKRKVKIRYSAHGKSKKKKQLKGLMLKLNVIMAV